MSSKMACQIDQNTSTKRGLIAKLLKTSTTTTTTTIQNRQKYQRKNYDYTICK